MRWGKGNGCPAPHSKSALSRDDGFRISNLSDEIWVAQRLEKWSVVVWLISESRQQRPCVMSDDEDDDDDLWADFDDEEDGTECAFSHPHLEPRASMDV